MRRQLESLWQKQFESKQAMCYKTAVRVRVHRQTRVQTQTSPFPNPPKKKRKENKKSSETLKNKTMQKKKQDLSGLMLPQTGDKTVASEAFGKLTTKQKETVVESIKKKTKKVVPFLIEPHIILQLFTNSPLVICEGCQSIGQRTSL